MDNDALAFDIINILSDSAKRKQINMETLMSIRATLMDCTDCTDLAAWNYEFLYAKFKNSKLAAEMHESLHYNGYSYMLARKIPYIKAVREWFKTEERVRCSLLDAKTLVETIIK